MTEKDTDTNAPAIPWLRIFVHVFIAVSVTYWLMGPGYWGPDALNSYIQAVIHEYCSAQTVFLPALFWFTDHFMHGALPVFFAGITLYFLGFAFFIFTFISDKFWASCIFFLLSFWPPLFCIMGVVQTETLQLGILSLFIPLSVLLYKYNGRYRRLLMVVAFWLLCSFWLIRLDTIPVAVILAYWLSFSFIKTNTIKIVGLTLLIMLAFTLTGNIVEGAFDYCPDSKQDMRNALMITDIAAISVESGTNYVPDYCWQPYIAAGEKNVGKLKATEEWRLAYFSFLFNINPSVGLFTHNTAGYTGDIIGTWVHTVMHHPLSYLKVHARTFFYYLFVTSFEDNLRAGIQISQNTNTKLPIQKSEAVNAFLLKHKNRFTYSMGNLILYNDDKPINAGEENELQALAGPKHISDVDWMVHYSKIPAKIYTQQNTIAENYYMPFCRFFERRLYILVWPFSYFALTIAGLIIFFRKIKDKYYRLTFLILCCCSVINILQHFLFITDAIYRFGIVSILFSFFAALILVAAYIKQGWLTRQVAK